MLSVRDLTCSSSAKCNLKDHKERSQSSSWLILLHSHGARTPGERQVTCKLLPGNSLEVCKGLLHTGNTLNWEIWEIHTQTHSSGCLQPTVHDPQRTAANYQLSQSQHHSTVRIWTCLLQLPSAGSCQLKSSIWSEFGWRSQEMHLEFFSFLSTCQQWNSLQALLQNHTELRGGIFKALSNIWDF